MRALKFAMAAVCAIALTPAAPAQALTSRTISLTMSAALATSTTYAFSGSVSKTTKGATVKLQRKNGSKWVDVVTVKTTANYSGSTGAPFNGTFKTSSTAAKYSYRTYAPTTSKWKSAVSSTKTVTVRKKVSVTLAPNPVFPAVNVPVSFTGKVSVITTGQVVEVRKRNGTSGTFVKLKKVTPNKTTRAFSTTDNSPEGSLVQYRSYVNQVGNYAAAFSSTVTIDRTTPEITSKTLPDASKDVLYSAALTTRNNRVGTWSVSSGSLPQGVSINGSRLEGTPTATGKATFELTFTENGGRVSAAVGYDLQVDGTLANPAHTQVVSGASYSCRLKTDTSLSCWGRNWKGELGVGPTGFDDVRKPRAVGTGWASVGAGLWTHTCGIKKDFTAWCWGDGTQGALAGVSNGYVSTPESAASGMHFKQIAAGLSHTCGIRTDGALWCWGQTSVYNGPPAVVSGSGVPTNWSQVDTGNGYTCAIDSSGKLWCWGFNDGWLGTEDPPVTHSLPTQVAGGGTWKSVATGMGHTCGIKADDSLWCWGRNGSGQLGDTTTTDRSVPIAVSGGGSWSAVAVGGFSSFNHTCGVKLDGTLWCWGSNDMGELGTGTSAVGANKSTPQQVPGTTWASAAVGMVNSCAVKTDDSTWCWGSNGAGEVGNDSFVSTPDPVQIN